MLDALLIAGEHEVVGVFDDGSVTDVMGVPVLGKVTLDGLAAHSIEGVVPAIGSNKSRQDWDQSLAGRVLFVTVCHPSAFVSPRAVLGPGTFVGPNAVVHTLAQIGRSCIVNSGAVIEHDVEVGDFVHVAPGAVICGGARVGSMVLIGAGARVVPLAEVGDGAIVGAGAVVLHKVPPGEVWAGVPAKSLAVGPQSDP